MGDWSLEGLSSSVSPLDESQKFGHNFLIKFKLQYTSSAFGKFKETPRLQYHEKILFVDHIKKENWVFESDQYARNPMSPSLGPWGRRYVEAYRNAKGQQMELPMKGSVVLTNLKGVPVTEKALGAGLQGAPEQAEAVRAYIKKHGGIFEITLHDIPCVLTDKVIAGTSHKERLLLFTIGMEGSLRKIRAEQYLNIVGMKGPNWKREFQMGGFKRSGLTIGTTRKVEPEWSVTRQGDAPFEGKGEYV